MLSVFESGGVLQIVGMLGSSQNVYFRLRDFGLLANDLSKYCFAPASGIFLIEAFQIFWVNITRLLKVQNTFFAAAFFLKPFSITS